MKAKFYWPMKRIIHVAFGILNVSFLNCLFGTCNANINITTTTAAATAAAAAAAATVVVVVVFIHRKISQIFPIVVFAQHVRRHFFAHFLMIDFQWLPVFSSK